jgi:hypothetical protein
MRALVLSLCYSIVQAADDYDYRIYGIRSYVSDSSSFRDIMKKCFAGFGFTSCEVIGDQPFSTNADDAYLKNNYHWKTEAPVGQKFCLSCCDNNRQETYFKDTWNLRCNTQNEADADVETDVYNGQFRIARRRSPDDSGYITCDIPRPPVVQVVKVDASNMAAGTTLGGYFTLKFQCNEQMAASDCVTNKINYNSVAMEWEEFKLNEVPGEGLGESMESKIGKILDNHMLLNEMAASNKPVTVSRNGPDDHGGYSWSITFPNGRLPSDIPPIEVGSFDSMSSGVVVTAEKRTPTQLHGYHMTIEVDEGRAGGKSWRNAKYCHVNTTEGIGQPEFFTESITLQMSGATAAAGLAQQALMCAVFVAAVLMPTNI